MQQGKKNLYQVIQEQMQIIDQLNQMIQKLTNQTIEQDSLIEGLLEHRNNMESVH